MSISYKVVRNIAVATSLLFLVFFAVTTVVSSYQEPLELSEARKELGLDEASYLHLSEGVTRYKYSKGDSDRAIVFIHGGGILGAEVWKKNVDYFVQKGYSTLTYDQFGRGYSDRPKVKYSLDLLYSQFLEVLDSVGLKNREIDIVTLSMGAMIAVKYFYEYPESVNRLILLSPAMLGGFEANSLLKAPGVSDFVMTYYWRPRYLEGRRKEFYSQVAYKEYAGIINYFSQIQGFKRVYLRTWLDILSSDVKNELSKLEATKMKNVFVVIGEKDPYVSDYSVNQLRDYLPECTLVNLPGLGHNINFEGPDLVNSRIYSFLTD